MTGTAIRAKISAVTVARLVALADATFVATRGIYQRISTRLPETRLQAQEVRHVQQLISSVSTDVPTASVNVHKLGNTLSKRAAGNLAYFHRTGTAYEPTEPIYGRFERLRGLASGFRSLTHYIARSLLEADGFSRTSYARLREPHFPRSQVGQRTQRVRRSLRPGL